MKYRMPERMTVFDTIEEARKYFCIANACSDCCLDCSQDERYSSCREYCAKHPEKAAKLMGYEVIKEEEHMNKQDKPRICEVLGVEVGELFTFKVGEITVQRATIGDDGIMYRLNPDMTVNGKIGGRILCGAINHPECIVRRKRFTSQEIEDAKAIKRLIIGATKISRKYGTLNVIVIRDYSTALNKELFPSIGPGESYTLDEIIGEG